MNHMKTWNAAGTWDIIERPQFPYDIYVHKTITLSSQPGIWEYESWGTGIVNKVGLANPGLDMFLNSRLPVIQGLADEFVVSIYGGPSVYYWEKLAEGLVDVDVELNLSCPNLGKDFYGTEQVWAAEVVRAVRARKPDSRIGAKLAPHHPLGLAKAVVEAGADYLTLTNSLQTPRGGLSGPPIRSLSLDLIRKVRRALPDVHIVGCGGIMFPGQVEEFLRAGADDVAIGTGHLLNNMESPLASV